MGSDRTDRADPRHDPEVVRRTLLEQRLGLLALEREHVARARQVVDKIESGDRAGSDAVLLGARRSRELAETALRLGVLDTERVGATSEQLIAASGLSADEIASIVARGSQRVDAP
jgi:hypothetical protein